MMTEIETINPDPIGAVFTPLEQAQKTINDWGLYEKWRQGDKILDPTAGCGHFIEAFIKTAMEKDHRISMKLISNLYAIEMQKSFIQSFHRNIKSKYGISFPEENFIEGDYLFTDLPLKADCLVGNPPWLNFCDLDEKYKEKIKPLFLESGLGGNKKDLLLGNSRIDLAALIVSESVRKNLKEGGRAFFYLPLSLFLGEGAHNRFRDQLNKGVLSADRVLDYRDDPIFPGVSTRYGFICFTKGRKTSYPIPYELRKKNGITIPRLATPLDEPGSPFVIHEPDEKWEIPRISIDKKSKPRQGLNTCGANRLFIFDSSEDKKGGLSLLRNKEMEALLPNELIYPLIGAGQFKGEQKHRFVFLPYGKDGRVLDGKSLSRFPEAESYLSKHRHVLERRKGVLIGSSIQKGYWWSLLGIGPYSFAPWKVVWEAYGKKDFRPKVFSMKKGKPWQPNQALQAFLPFDTEEEAQSAITLLKDERIENILKSQGMEGTCNWAQPGRMMKFFRIKSEN